MQSSSRVYAGPATHQVIATSGGFPAADLAVAVDKATSRRLVVI